LPKEECMYGREQPCSQLGNSMNMDKLEIKRGDDKYQYVLEYDRIRISSYIGGYLNEYTCKYEGIEFEETIRSYKPSLLSYVLYFSVTLNFILLLTLVTYWFSNFSDIWMVTVALVFTFSPFIIIWGFRLFKPRYEKLLRAPVTISFFYEKKHRKPVDDFIELMKVRQKEFMRSRYLRIDRVAPPDHQEKIISMLFERGFISLSEYEVLVEELDRLRTTRGNIKY